MPQIILGRNYGDNTNIGASQLQTNAFLNAVKQGTIERERADQALNKAVAFMQKYNFRPDSEITNKNGIVTNNDILRNQMQPKKQDLSRDKEMSFQRNIVRTSQDKMNEVMGNGAGLLNRKPFEGTNFTDKDEVFDKAAGGAIGTLGDAGASATVKLMQMLGVGAGGGNGGASLRKDESESGTVSITGPSITGAGHDYEVLADTQQAFKDNFGYDTRSARMLSEFEEIGALASGREYDPNKDVYLTGALGRDKDLNEANKNDMAIQAALSKALDRGGEGAYSTGGVSASHSRSYGGGTTTNIITNNDLGGGDPKKEPTVLLGTRVTNRQGTEIDKKSTVQKNDDGTYTVVARNGTYDTKSGIVTDQDIPVDDTQLRAFVKTLPFGTGGAFQNEDALIRALNNKRDTQGQHNAIRFLRELIVQEQKAKGNEATFRPYKQENSRLLTEAIYVNGEPYISFGVNADGDLSTYEINGQNTNNVRKLGGKYYQVLDDDKDNFRRENEPPPKKK